MARSLPKHFVRDVHGRFAKLVELTTRFSLGQEIEFLDPIPNTPKDCWRRPGHIHEITLDKNGDYRYNLILNDNVPRPFFDYVPEKYIFVKREDLW